eukprot:TRINITY_DN24996_c0_g1_i1.p1 TRINITY_DN24996_c0_g1~~TRINITY_DN24996_c0_g1_i1.p1  ORF type:complete len:897 (+),score=262.34 TRINITY_DN24996_c0_g1_i1:67-2757(+)
MSWFSDRLQEKVNKFVREASQHQVPDAFRGLAQAQPRTADELAAELEKEAKRVVELRAALDLVSRWVDRSEGGQGSFPLAPHGLKSQEIVITGSPDPLSFHEVLLRSSALEVLLEALGRAPAIRQELLKGELEGDSVRLAQALRSLAGRLLVPGALAFWQTLLEVLVACSGQEATVDSSTAASLGTTLVPPRCGSWARRTLATVKKKWQSEALPAYTRRVDRELVALACGAGGSAATGQAAKGSEGEPSAASHFMARGGKMLSKEGIRAAHAREKAEQCSQAALRLRMRVELLCNLCDRLDTLEKSISGPESEVEKLLAEADEMLIELDQGVKDLTAEQADLEKSMADVNKGLDEQLKTHELTLGSFTEKRAQLQDEQRSLMLRLEEVNLHLEQIDQATAACQQESNVLRGQMRDATNGFKDKIAASFCQQKRLADEKLHAVACKECAHTALDIVRNETKRRKHALGIETRRRRAELRRTSAAYVHQERLRLEASVAASAGFSPSSSSSAPAPRKPSGGDSPIAVTKNAGSKAGAAAENGSSKAVAAAEESWRSAQSVMKRVGPLLAAEAAAAKAAAERRSVDGSAPEPGEDASEAPSEPASPSEFFAKTLSGQHCVDCDSPDADWASLSYGTYLCVDCAGRHRGLGVHLSFVRSTSMDIWRPEQLRRMQLGGTARFQAFLGSYPKLKEPPRTSTALTARYSSRAAAYYRRLLDTRCESGNASNVESPPSAETGHLPASDLEGASAADGGDADGAGETEDDCGTLEEELAALEEAYLRQREPSEPKNDADDDDMEGGYPAQGSNAVAAAVTRSPSDEKAVAVDQPAKQAEEEDAKLNERPPSPPPSAGAGVEATPAAEAALITQGDAGALPLLPAAEGDAVRQAEAVARPSKEEQD